MVCYTFAKVTIPWRIWSFPIFLVSTTQCNRFCRCEFLPLTCPGHWMSLRAIICHRVSDVLEEYTLVQFQSSLFSKTGLKFISNRWLIEYTRLRDNENRRNGEGRPAAVDLNRFLCEMDGGSSNQLWAKSYNVKSVSVLFCYKECRHVLVDMNSWSIIITDIQISCTSRSHFFWR